MVQHADALVCYRTYPHIDMAETGQRAAALLAQRLAGTPRSRVALRQLPYLIPLCWQSTDIEPSRSLYQLVGKLETRGAQSVSLPPGSRRPIFPTACPPSGPTAQRKTRPTRPPMR